MSFKSVWFLVVQFFLFACYAVSFAVLPSLNPPISIKVISCIVAASGLAIFIAALLAHNAVNKTPVVNISPAPRVDRELVVTGAYALVRHPIYFGALLIVFGCGVALATI